MTLQVPRPDLTQQDPPFIALLQGFFFNIPISSEQPPSPAHPGLSCPAFQAMGPLEGNGGSWSPIPASWGDLVSPLCLCLGKGRVKLVCLFGFFLLSCFLFFYFTQLHLSSPWGCPKQEAQLQTPPKHGPILRCGLYLRSPLSFSPQDRPGKLLLHEHKHPHHTSCSPRAPEPLTVPPGTTKTLSWPLCGLGPARPSRKRPPLLQCFLEN